MLAGINVVISHNKTEQKNSIVLQNSKLFVLPYFNNIYEFLNERINLFLYTYTTKKLIIIIYEYRYVYENIAPLVQYVTVSAA